MTKDQIKNRQAVIAILKKHAANLRRNPTKEAAPHLAWLLKNIEKQENRLAKYM